jgi:predicted outer membrane protein
MLKIAFVVALLGSAAAAFASDVTFDQRSLAADPTAASQVTPEAPRAVCACAHHGAATK